MGSRALSLPLRNAQQCLKEHVLPPAPTGKNVFPNSCEPADESTPQARSGAFEALHDCDGLDDKHRAVRSCTAITTATCNSRLELKSWNAVALQLDKQLAASLPAQPVTPLATFDITSALFIIA